MALSVRREADNYIWARELRHVGRAACLREEPPAGPGAGQRDRPCRARRQDRPYPGRVRAMPNIALGELQKVGSYRAILAVPLMREGVPDRRRWG